MNYLVKPFTIAIPEKDISDLQQKLDLVRWPVREVVDDWSQGVPLENMKALVDYWRHGYNWRRCEKKINAFDQFITQIDGVDIHFLHVRSPNSDALPLMMTPGWPGSIVEFLKIIGPLTQPEAHGGNTADAFHLIIPTIPGFGFSGKPVETGWTVPRIAKAWQILMQRLGYKRYVVQGGGMGAAIASILGNSPPQALAAIHVNLPFVLPHPPYENLSSQEQAALDTLAYMDRWGTGYALAQASRPQTLGYSLSDSPVGQAAWIYEKLAAWSDCDGIPENIFTFDEILDSVMLYWLTNSSVSSSRFYWDNWPPGFWGIPIDIPTGCSIFPKEIYRAPRSWADKYISNIIYWNEPSRGGHFAAFEQPEIFVDELRKCFRIIR